MLDPYLIKYFYMKTKLQFGKNHCYNINHIYRRQPFEIIDTLQSKGYSNIVCECVNFLTVYKLNVNVKGIYFL